MKVLLFTLEYPPFKGGVSKYYENLVKHWPNQEEIAVLNNNDGKLINAGLPFLKWLPSVWQLWRAVRTSLQKGGKGGYHILVGHILPLGTAAYINFKLFKIPYSVILHGMDFTFCLKSARKKWLAKKILKNAQNIICASGYTAKLVKQFVGEKMAGKIKVVNPGVNAQLKIKNYPPASQARALRAGELKIKLIKKYDLKDKIVLFSIGRLVKRKGFDKVIEALPKILKEVPNLVYAIAGIGPDEEYLKELAEKNRVILSISEGSRGFRETRDSSPRRLRMTGNIFFLGKITDEEKWAWLNLCDIFTMPSRQIGDDFEGFGIVYLEASLCGKPIVAGRSGGVEDAVLDGETGLLVNPEDTKEIADAIIKLAKDEGLRKSLGEAGKKRAGEEFNWRRQVKKIYSIIKTPL